MPSVFVTIRTPNQIWHCEMLQHRNTAKVSQQDEFSLSIPKFTPDCYKRELINVQRSFNKTLNYGNVRLRHFPNITMKRKMTMNDLEHAFKSFNKPHRYWIPLAVPPCVLLSSTFNHFFDCPASDSFSIPPSMSQNQESFNRENCKYAVHPKQRCVIIADAHVVSSIRNAMWHSHIFCVNFIQKLKVMTAFKTCTLIEDSQQDHQYHPLSCDYSVELLLMWPWQKMDYACCKRIVGLLNKHVVLEESFAWLSTLGGAHSSLGESFLIHAERAGEISTHQLQLAKELGNEIMIARCHLYWAWSLLQRGYLSKCKLCVIYTWNYSHRVKCYDKVLGNMCKAVWKRLQFERSQLKKQKSGIKKHYNDETLNSSNGKITHVKNV